MRRSLAAFRSFIIFVVIAAMLVAAMPFCLSVSAANRSVRATAPLNLRSAPSASAPLIKTLPMGTVMSLMENSADGWAHITGGGDTGYASADYLEVPTGSDVIITAVADEYLNLRSGKGTSYSVAAVIPKHASVSVADNSDDSWACVCYEDVTGYASKDFLTFRLRLPSKTQAAATEPAAVTEPTQPAADTHRSASFSDLPTTAATAASDIHKIMLSSCSVSLNINQTYALTVIDAAARPLTRGLQYESSDPHTVTVSADGVLTGIGKGKATVTVTQLSTGLKCSCSVTVSSKVDPTQPPTQAPTQPPTQKPTQPPTQPPTQKPTTPPEENLSLSAASATVYLGCYYQIIAKTTDKVQWSSSNSSVAAVSSNGIVTAQAVGTAVITAKAGTASATCKISVKSGRTVELSHSSATVTAGKTFLARSYTDGVTWSSADSSVAAVNNGYILAKKAGKTVITAAVSGGAATMLVTVQPAAPIRFAYTSPNCAYKNQKVSLIAITDPSRTGVRFEVTIGASTITVNADTCEKDGSTLLWTGTMSFKEAGTYRVTAYSQLNGKWTTCDDAETTAFVSDTTDRTTTVCTRRRASDELIRLIANFEGYISSIYDDPITGDPTVGYGRVIFSGQQFYNTMTKNEAYAYLVQTVNNDGYSSSVNHLLVDNGVRFNQQQFDALVCLVYNTGSGVLSGDSELQAVLLNCYDGAAGKTTYFINGSYVRIRKGAGTSYDIIRELDYGTTVTVLSTANAAWTKVKLSDGTVGFVSSDYISKRTSGGKLDLNYVDRQTLINKFCAYHHAAGECIRGLLYRRVDEMEMFFYGDYDRNYGIYNYDIQYQCARNPSFHT